MGDLISKEKVVKNSQFLSNFQNNFIFLQDHVDSRLGRVKIY